MIPQYRKLMLPILKICKDDKKLHRNELASLLADQFELTQEERNQVEAIMCKQTPNDQVLIFKKIDIFHGC